jgi:hypothetical protein
VQDGEPGDYMCVRRTPPSPTAGQGWMFETEVAPATASQQLASLMDAHAYHDLAGVISPISVLKFRARARHIGVLA